MCCSYYVEIDFFTLKAQVYTVKYVRSPRQVVVDQMRIAGHAWAIVCKHWPNMKTIQSSVYKQNLYKIVYK